MNPANHAFLFRELQMIQKIIEDETWLEGERRGCYVSQNDCVVRENVCSVVLRIGAELRASVTRAIASEPRTRTADAAIAEALAIGEIHDAAAA